MTAIDRRTFIAGTAALAAGAGAAEAQTGAAPDLIVRNARITTMDRSRPEARALAIRDGRFLAVGPEAEVLPLAAGATRILDAAGRRLIPGLNDSHTHTVRGGLNYALELRWDGVPTFREAMERLRIMVARTPPGQWVRVVGGFSRHQFADEKRLPTLDELNALTPDTPIFVLNLYVGALLNKAALRALGVTRDTPDNRWPGGAIQRGAGGEPTGLLLATPSALILYDTLYKGPHLDPAQQRVSTRHFMRELNRLGITSTLDCGGGYQSWPDDYTIIRDLARDGELTMRIGMSTFIQRPGRELEDFTGWTRRYRASEGDAWFRMIGGGEMLVRSIYDFEVFNLPRPELAPEADAELEAVLRLLARERWPFRFHATYDETIGRHLDVIERVHRDIPLTGLNWIVDHGETLGDRNLERIARLGGGIAVQNRIAFQEQEFLDRYGAAAAAEAPPIRKMLAMGVPVGAGTDMSRVSSYSPWLCVEWLVTGKGVGGTQLLGERTRLDRETALRIWTDNAWFSSEQDEKGRIAPGLLADFAVLNQDPFTTPDERLRDTESVLTIVGGRVGWAAEEFAPLMPELPPLKPDWSPVNRFGGFYRRS
jgi:hypothetical protein